LMVDAASGCGDDDIGETARRDLQGARSFRVVAPAGAGRGQYRPRSTSRLPLGSGSDERRQDGAPTAVGQPLAIP
jgi:hypothetical protein